MKEIIFLTLFIWFKNIYFWLKYSTSKNFKNNLFNFITLNEENFFSELKKIFLRITLHIYYATAQSLISLIQWKKKQSRNLFKLKKLLFYRIAKHIFLWSKDNFFKSKKLFSGRVILYLFKFYIVMLYTNGLSKCHWII